jgi:hypothetical protein
VFPALTRQGFRLAFLVECAEHHWQAGLSADGFDSFLAGVFQHAVRPLKFVPEGDATVVAVDAVAQECLDLVGGAVKEGADADGEFLEQIQLALGAGVVVFGEFALMNFSWGQATASAWCDAKTALREAALVTRRCGYQRRWPSIRPVQARYRPGVLSAQWLRPHHF